MRQMTVSQLKTRLDSGADAPLVLDVREPWELGLCRLPGAVPIPMGQIPARLAELPRDRDIVVLCHHGMRSMQVCMYMQRQGFEHLHNLGGGIDAWAREIDPKMARY